MIRDLLKPNWETGTVISQIPIGRIKSLGMKLLILDVDGTLVSGRDILIPKTVSNWITEAKQVFTIHLLSNNPSSKRIGNVAKQLDLEYTFGAGKPRTKHLSNILSKYTYNYTEIGLIGDRIFTDILVGNRMGIYTVLVKSLNSKGASSDYNFIQIMEKRLATLLNIFIK